MIEDYTEGKQKERRKLRSQPLVWTSNAIVQFDH